MDSPEENTQKLKLRARELINPKFRNFNNDVLKENVSPRKQAFKNNAHKPGSVQEARKKIRDEWEALKNTTVINRDRLTDPENNRRISKESDILYGTVIYIEIPNLKRINILKAKLEKLGATVKDDFTQEVTHVIYKNGSLETFKRAKLLNVHLVSVLWIQACENSKTKICEKLFPAYEKNVYANSPRVFRKFWAHEEKNFQYDENAGTILRKPQDINQSIVNHMKNLEINLESQSLNNNENGDQTNQNSNSNEHVIRNKTSKGNSSSESIRLQLSSEKENSENDTNPTPTTEDNELNTSLNKIKIPTKRRLYVKNTSYVPCSYSDNSSNSQIDQVVVPNPYTLMKHNDNRTKIKSPINRIKIMRTKHLPRSGLKNVQYKNKLPTLVTSYFHSEENKIVKDIVKRLGGFHFKFKVDSTTTHVVVGECQRTPNVLKGMARGCWILDKQWIFESADAGHWLSEEHFELINFSKIVQRCRIQKQAFGKYFSFDVFDECGLIFISKNCASHYDDLKELVKLSGGKLTDKIADSKIIVGVYIEDSTKKCVSTEWILDSITFGRCKTMKPNYVLTSS